MKKRLMKIGVSNMLQCTEDLALKSFVVAHCVAHEVEHEATLASHCSEPKERIAELEHEKLKDLQLFRVEPLQPLPWSGTRNILMTSPKNKSGLNKPRRKSRNF